MKQILLKKGQLLTADIPLPTIKDGFIRIKVFHSCISAGTEKSGISESRKGLLSKAYDKPKKIKSTIEYIKNYGLNETIQKLNMITERYVEIGYSIAGQIDQVGKNIDNFNVGDFVAAGGMNFAVHAEYVIVPKNLVVKLPDGLNTKYACTATVGSISLHGVRRADLKIGELAVVYGTGLLGLICVQILKASGVRVACVDIDDQRLIIAKKCGAELTTNPKNEDSVLMIQNWSAGFGVDAVLFAANTSNNESLSFAFQMTRKKGKVVLIGVSGMEINRHDIYSKEIDLLISTSYGPGRYDDNYELKGIDYPYSFVRWTENRNIKEFLRLLKAEHINLDLLNPAIYPLEEFKKAFKEIENQSGSVLTIIQYPLETVNNNRITNVPFKKLSKGILNIALIGTGSFAVSTILPIIKKLPERYKLITVANRNQKKAYDIAMQFDGLRIAENIDVILKDDRIDVIIISTRHDSHADLALQCLEAGKNVFVEKPLAVNTNQLTAIKNYFLNTGDVDKPLLMVGFNRRFSLYAQEIKTHIARRVNPFFAHYRMNAGYSPRESWVHDDGGRIIGEACHIIDLMIFFAGCTVKEVSVSSLTPYNEYYNSDDNKTFTLIFEDGSIAVIDYFAVGNKNFPKEFLEIHFDNKTITLDDYKKLNGFGIKVKNINSNISRKGHYEEFIALHEALTNKQKSWPITLKELFLLTEVTFLINQL